MLDEVVGTARRMRKAGNELREYKVLLINERHNELWQFGVMVQ
jgi:hypothetical protein